MRTFNRQWYGVVLALLAQSMDQGYGSSRTSRYPYLLLQQNTMAPDHGPIVHFWHVYGESGPRNTGTSLELFDWTEISVKEDEQSTLQLQACLPVLLCPGLCWD